MSIWTDDGKSVDIDKLAEAVAARLKGQLSGFREDVAGLKADVAEVKVTISDTASKVDQLTDWYQELNGRVAPLEKR